MITFVAPSELQGGDQRKARRSKKVLGRHALMQVEKHEILSIHTELLYNNFLEY